MRNVFLLVVMGIASGSASAADRETLRFTGKVLRVEVLGNEPVVPVDVDPRFAVAVEILGVPNGIEPFPFTVGETRVFAVHSPTRVFTGEAAVGARFEFDLVREGTGLPPHYSDLRAYPLGAAASDPTPPPTNTASVSSAEVAAEIWVPETVCRVDADCGVALVHLDGPYTCCLGCGTSTAGTVAWVEHVEEVCAGVDVYRVVKPGPGDLVGCPPLACPQGPTRAACTAGRCVFKW